jgi:hypothetical protein
MKLSFWSNQLHKCLDGVFFLYLVQQPPVGQGLLIQEVSRAHITTHHSRYDSSGGVISPSQRPLRDTTKQSQQTEFHTPRWDYEPTILSGEWPQTYALDGRVDD